jgi:hypothetical protein
MANYCFVQPILPGGHEAMKQWAREGITGNAGHDATFKQAGISREQVWIQRTPMGDFAVVSMEMKDPAKAFQHLATSKDPWAAQFRALIRKAHGIDITKPVQPNEQLVDWKA